MASNNDPLFGVVAYDANGRKLSRKEREEIARNNPIPQAPDPDDWFTPADLPPLSTVETADDTPAKTSNSPGNPFVELAQRMLSIPVGTHYPIANTSTGGNQNDPEKPRGIFAIADAVQGTVGSIGIIVLGIVLIVLAFLVTDMGKSAAKMVVTKGAA